MEEKILCHCNSITEEELVKVIKEGAKTVEEVAEKVGIDSFECCVEDVAELIETTDK